MKVHTPEISWHERDPVYSVDFQPGKRRIKRLATGGVDKFVRIWQVVVGQDGKGNVEFLSNLKRHTKAVNVCRFSPDGDTLASAGDVILMCMGGFSHPAFTCDVLKVKAYQQDITVVHTFDKNYVAECEILEQNAFINTDYISVTSRDKNITRAEPDSNTISSATQITQGFVETESPPTTDQGTECVDQMVREESEENEREEGEISEEELDEMLTEVRKRSLEERKINSVIIFWKLSDTTAPVNNIFQEEEEDNKETWTTVKILRGHLEDVYDLCWSSDAKYMISGSVDNSAILWDLTKDQKLALFNEHKSFVQGVTFDPLNEYIATLSTDRSCRIYSLANKTCLHNISKMTLPAPTQNETTGNKTSDKTEEVKPETAKPKSVKLFHDDTMRSFFRRLSFSPDGEILVVPAGCLEIGEKVVNATYLFSRHSFSKPVVYLPSPDKATICTRCCPVLFELRKISRNDNTDQTNNNLKEWEKYLTMFCLPYRIVFAVGTEDAILLYDTQQETPFAYISNIHYHQLSDMSWSPDGDMLLVSSTDGFCTTVVFDEGEIGDPYIPKESSPALSSIKDSKQSSPTTSISSSKSEDPVSMDTDSCSSDLKLVLETSNDDPAVSDSSKPREKSATESRTDKDSEQKSENNVQQSKQTKSVSTGLTIRSATGSQQPRRIQVTTLSLKK